MSNLCICIIENGKADSTLIIIVMASGIYLLMIHVNYLPTGSDCELLNFQNQTTVKAKTTLATTCNYFLA